MARLSANSHQAKVLTDAVTNFIINGMHLINTVDGEGFLSLMEVTEPHYSVPSRKTIMGLIDQKFLCKQNPSLEIRATEMLKITVRFESWFEWLKWGSL